MKITDIKRCSVHKIFKNVLFIIKKVMSRVCSKQAECNLLQIPACGEYLIRS